MGEPTFLSTEIRGSKHHRADYYLERRLARPWGDLLRHAKSPAARRGLAFELTDQWASERWSGACEITGIPFRLVVADRPGAHALSPALDRIDKAKGFVPSNCRFVLASVAALRGFYASDAQAVVVARRLVTNASPEPDER
jgi:hypothetical protein